jgi:hypothetical protein
MLWKERNDRTFNNRARSFDLFLQDTFDEGKLWDLAGFRQLRLLLQWSLLDVFPM